MTSEQRRLIQEAIELLVDNGADLDADETNASPEDMSSHVSGLAVKRLRQVLAASEPQKGQ